MICQNCGTQNAEGVKFCRECGAPLGLTDAPPTQPRATSSSSVPTIQQLYVAARKSLIDFGVSSSTIPETMPTAKNIRESLARLGITFSREQIVGFAISLIGGMIVARILPFIYPIFDPILTFAFGSGPGEMRDGFNTNMMTLITFATSFVLSFATMFVTTTLKR